MPWIEHTCYTAECDGCGTDTDTGDFIPHYPHMRLPDGWIDDGDKAYCDECQACELGDECDAKGGPYCSHGRVPAPRARIKGEAE